MDYGPPDYSPPLLQCPPVEKNKLGSRKRLSRQ